MRRPPLWLAALAVDIVAGEPPSALHPVVAAGRLVTALGGGRQPDPTRRSRDLWRGLLLVALPAGLAAILGRLVERVRPTWLRLACLAWLLKSSFALRALLDTGARVEELVARGELTAARSELRSLVSRPVEDLDEGHIESAIVESLAENLCDSYVAPLCWFAVGGLPAALTYRVINTADAMVGYHGPYEYLGKAAARLDDLVNVVPARITAATLVAAAPLVGEDARRALEVGWRDHGRTESPNAGWPMATAAGALGLWVEKPGTYRLGDGGRSPAVGDGARARRLVLAAAALTTAAFVGIERRRG